MSIREALSGLFILVTLALAIFAGLYVLYVYSFEYLLLLLSIVTAVGSILLAKSRYRDKVRTDIDLEEYKKILKRTTHPLFYGRIMKRVTLKDDGVSAEIDYRMECKNTSSARLEKIKHEVEHDGRLESLSACVNRDDFTKGLTLENYHTVRVLDDGTEVDIQKPFTLKLVFDLTAKNIEPGEDFGYGYTFSCEELFPKIREKDIESTAVFINHPTSRLIVSVEVPGKMRFVPEGVYVKIFSKHEVEDYGEENRCNAKYPHKLLNNRRRILWEVVNPKIASYYVLYIQAFQEDRTIVHKA